MSKTVRKIIPTDSPKPVPKPENPASGEPLPHLIEKSKKQVLANPKKAAKVLSEWIKKKSAS